MNRKIRNALKLISILLVLIAVFIELGSLSISFINPHSFWLVVVGFGLLLISTR